MTLPRGGWDRFLSRWAVMSAASPKLMYPAASRKRQAAEAYWCKWGGAALMPCRAHKESSDAPGVRSGAKAIRAVQPVRRLHSHASQMFLKLGCVSWPCCKVDGQPTRVSVLPVLHSSIHTSGTVAKRGTSSSPDLCQREVLGHVLAPPCEYHVAHLWASGSHQ